MNVLLWVLQLANQMRALPRGGWGALGVFEMLGGNVACLPG